MTHNVSSFRAYLSFPENKPERQPWGLVPDLSEEAPSWEGGAVFFLKGQEGAEGVDLSLPPGISHFLSPPSFRPLPVMCIFPSAPASQTDSLPRQGSNFQNKTFSTKENITMGRKTFQYQASWDPRKCTECLSGNDAALTSRTSLRTWGEQCLALGSGQTNMAWGRATLVFKLPQTGKSKMCVQYRALKQTLWWYDEHPTQREAPGYVLCQSLIVPSTAKDMAIAGLLPGKKVCLLHSWILGNC